MPQTHKQATDELDALRAKNAELCEALSKITMARGNLSGDWHYVHSQSDMALIAAEALKL